MRELCTLEGLRERGVTRAARAREWTRITQGVYGAGREPPSSLDRARATVVATGGIACGRLAGVLLGLDGITLGGPVCVVSPGSSARRPRVQRRQLPAARIVTIGEMRCTDALQTLIDLARDLDDLTWEQALESALRRRLTSVKAVSAVQLSQIQRVMALRPPGTRPTESLLETLMVQLARRVPGLPAPTRQYDVYDAHGCFVARVDLAWPELGVFIELDGQHHPGQPVHDARRQTAVAAATGWLCGRFTWHEVVRVPATTARRLSGLMQQSRCHRPSA